MYKSLVLFVCTLAVPISTGGIKGLYGASLQKRTPQQNVDVSKITDLNAITAEMVQRRALSLEKRQKVDVSEITDLNAITAEMVQKRRANVDKRQTKVDVSKISDLNAITAEMVAKRGYQ